jgi:hypothetical protein
MRSHQHLRAVFNAQLPLEVFSLISIREGMRFVQEAILKKLRGSDCRMDGNWVTISPVGMLNQQVGFREMLVNHVLESLSVFVNEHRRKAPTWGSPRIPECM